MFNEVRENAVENKCYGEEIRKELKKDKTDLALLNAYKVPYKKFVKNGDVEQFYTYCYSNIIVYSDTYLSTYSQHAGTLLLLKLTDRLIVFAKNESKLVENIKQELTEDLSDKEKHGLKYIGGYILQKLYRKFKTSDHWKSHTSQEAVAFLNAAKSNQMDEYNWINFNV